MYTNPSYPQMAQAIQEADAILIGASNGLSITEGLHLFADNQAFEDVFGDLKRRYGLRCILHGAMLQWPTQEEQWGFWSRLVSHYSGSYTGSPAMTALKQLVGDKDYFIVTTNGECHFELVGFDSNRIYELEGNWMTMQCATPCHSTIYPAMEQIMTMAKAEQNGRVPSELLPRCPKCGGPMKIHMEGDHTFIHDMAARSRMQQFLQQYHGKKLVILELGIGMRNQLIKAPLMQLTAQEPQATYITINLGEVYIPANIASKSHGINGEMTQALQSLVAAMA